MWKAIKERIKSPVVIIQVISIIVGIIVYFIPNKAEAINVISTGIVAIINLFAGLNNPTDNENF